MNAQYFQAVCESYGLPKPEAEVLFSNERRFRLDFAWRDLKLGIEVQGGIWMAAGAHSRPLNIQRDHTKNNLAVSLGWRILLFEPKKLLLTESMKIIKTTIELIQQQKKNV